MRVYRENIGYLENWKHFPSGSVVKESACSAQKADSTPGSGGSPGEEIGYPL